MLSSIIAPNAAATAVTASASHNRPTAESEAEGQLLAILATNKKAPSIKAVHVVHRNKHLKLN